LIKNLYLLKGSTVELLKLFPSKK